MSDFEERTWNWDDDVNFDEIESFDDFVVLPEGRYRFKVIDVERRHYNGGAKLPPCDELYYSMEFKDPNSNGKTIVNDHIYVLPKMLWKFKAFAGCVDEKPIENMGKFKDTLVGKEGDAELIVQDYENKNNEKKQRNNIKNYIKKTTKGEEKNDTYEL